MSTSDDGGSRRAGPARRVPLARGLSTKLLVLTVLFVLIAEVLIFLPSVANFRLQWLEQRLGTAAAVAEVLLHGNPDSLSQAAQNDVLMAIGAKAIAVRDAGVSRLHGGDRHAAEGRRACRPRPHRPFQAISDALGELFSGGKRMLRVFGPVGESDKEFELIIGDAQLRQAMLIYARNVALPVAADLAVHRHAGLLRHQPHDDPADPRDDALHAGFRRERRTTPA